MIDTLPLRFKGAPGSPYTRKMLAVLRYRRLPYEFLIGNQADKMGMPKPKVSLLPTFYLPNADGEIEAVVDSTPLIRRFEQTFEGRSVIPPDPVMAFLDYLIEDYADEWLTKPMFHYRWYYAADIEKAGKILPLWRGLSRSDTELETAAREVRERQISRLYVVGSNDTTAAVIEASYERALDILETMLKQQPFVMGGRPGACDFGIYAQMTQLAQFDPTPMQLCVDQAPRVYAWVDIMNDLSGLPEQDGVWLQGAAARDTLGDLLTEIGRVYAPAMLANQKALAGGEKQWEGSIDGHRWVQPTFPYQGKSLGWVRERFAALGADDRRVAEGILAGTGCEALFKGA